MHPFSDAGMLAEEMPNARLIEADSLVELRVQPERLTDEIAASSTRSGARRARGRATRGTAHAERSARPSGARGGAARSAPPGSYSRREQFDFVDADVAGRLRRADRRCGRLADPQRMKR